MNSFRTAVALFAGLMAAAQAQTPVTLHHVLVHVTSETQRHAGHADIIREFIDGSAGLLDGHDNLRIGDPTAWRRFFDQVEDAARVAGGD